MQSILLQLNEKRDSKIEYDVFTETRDLIGHVSIIQLPKNCIEISSIFILFPFRNQEYEIEIINKFLADKTVHKVIISPTKQTVKFWQKYVDSSIKVYDNKVLTK